MLVWVFSAKYFKYVKTCVNFTFLEKIYEVLDSKCAVNYALRFQLTWLTLLLVTHFPSLLFYLHMSMRLYYVIHFATSTIHCRAGLKFESYPNLSSRSQVHTVSGSTSLFLWAPMFSRCAVQTDWHSGSGAPRPAHDLVLPFVLRVSRKWIWWENTLRANEKPQKKRKQRCGGTCLERWPRWAEQQELITLQHGC